MSGRSISVPVARARGRVAALSRSRTSDDPDFIRARRDLAALTLEEHVQRALDNAPPLTDEQVERVAALLRAGGGAA